MVQGADLNFHADSHHPKGVDSLSSFYAVVNSGIPIGGIILWSGAITAIPYHWNICDGTNGTPDLRDKFVVGAGSTYAVAATGGSAAFTHASQGGHDHDLIGTEALSHTNNHNGQSHVHGFGTVTGAAAGVDFSAWSGADTATGDLNLSSHGNHTVSSHQHNTEGAHAHDAHSLPPYYALAYIMRIT